MVRLSAGARLLGFGLVVSFTHHLGLLTDPLGSLGPVRTNDWLDLLVPFLVVGSAAWAMLAARPDRWAWLVLGVGAVAYVEGHGLHLAANAIAHSDPSDVAHLHYY